MGNFAALNYYKSNTNRKAEETAEFLQKEDNNLVAHLRNKEGKLINVLKQMRDDSYIKEEAFYKSLGLTTDLPGAGKEYPSKFKKELKEKIYGEEGNIINLVISRLLKAETADLLASDDQAIDIAWIIKKRKIISEIKKQLIERLKNQRQKTVEQPLAKDKEFRIEIEDIFKKEGIDFIQKTIGISGVSLFINGRHAKQTELKDIKDNVRIIAHFDEKQLEPLFKKIEESMSKGKEQNNIKKDVDIIVEKYVEYFYRFCGNENEKEQLRQFFNFTNKEKNDIELYIEKRLNQIVDTIKGEELTTIKAYIEQLSGKIEGKYTQSIIDGLNSIDFNWEKIDININDYVNKEFTQEELDKILSRLISQQSGYVSNVQGIIGEAIAAICINKAMKTTSTQILGQDANKKGQSSHADLLTQIEDLLIGHQIKFYKGSLNTINGLYAKQYSLYDKDFDRYIGAEDLSAFELFLSIYQYTNYEEYMKNIQGENANKYVFGTDKQELFFNLRLSYFMRFEDLFAGNGYESLQNNFFIINFSIVPASFIIQEIIDQINDQSDNKLITVSERNTYDFDDYENNIKSLKNYKINFKGIKIDLTNANAAMFL